MKFAKVFCGFYLDKRSLALGRICVSSVLLIDILNRSRWLEQHYTDNGILPRYLAVEYFFFPTWFSFHLATGTLVGQACLFIIHFLLIVSLLLGYRTKISCTLNWIYVVSLQFRNITILHGGDTLLRLTLFYFIFLPIGDICSLDYLLKHKKTQSYRQEQQIRTRNHVSYRVCDFATAAFILNLSQMYLWNYINKNGVTWNEEYTASFYALQMEFFLLPFGRLLFYLFSPFLFQLFTRLVMWVEGYGWILFFSPFETDKVRLFSVIMFGSMHLSFGLSLAIGIFSLITIACVLVLLPSLFWEWVEVLWKNIRIQTNDTLHYNPNCFYDQLLVFIFSHFLIFVECIPVKQHESPYLSQTAFGVTHNGQYYSEELATIHLCSFHPLSHFIYSFACVQKLHKYFLMKKGAKGIRYHRTCFSSRTNIILLSVWKSFSMLAVLWTFAWCLAVLYNFSFYPPYYSVGTTLHLDATWNMFAPDPPKEDTHIILEGLLTNTSRIDLFRNRGIFTWHGSPLLFQPSDSFASDIQSHRWEKYYSSLLGHKSKEKLQIQFLQWICTEWNSHNSVSLDTITLHIGKKPYTKPFEKQRPSEFSKIFIIRSLSCLQLGNTPKWAL